jgi:Bacterial regulatory proteins, luxR family
VAGGWSNTEIGERLHISAATAKTHVSRLLMKLGAHDRAQLVMIAYETGLVTPAELHARCAAGIAATPRSTRHGRSD